MYRIDQVSEIVSNMLGDRLVTHQTGPQGAHVSRVMIAQSVQIERETYFAIVMDRSTGGPLLIGSLMGGMDIESVARDHPSQIFTVCLSVSIVNKKPPILTFV